MKQLDFTFTAPLDQDEHGSVRITDSRVTLEMIVGACNLECRSGQAQPEDNQ